MRRRRRDIGAATLTGIATAAVTVTNIVAALPAAADTGGGPPGGWGPVIACESGGRADAQNPSSTASGLFQFLDTSWIAYGGGQYASRAKFATPAQQLAVANRAFAQSGLSPWAASQGCWGGKLGSSLGAGLVPAATAALVPSKPRHAAASAPAIPLPHTDTAPKHAAVASGPAGSVPVEASTQAAGGDTAPAEVAAGPTVTVAPGDCLSMIASAHGVSDWNALWTLNRDVIGDNPDLIYAGQVLTLPA